MSTRTLPAPSFGQLAPSFGRLLTSESRKLATLPAIWALLAATVLIAAAAAWMFSATYRDSVSAGRNAGASRELLDIALRSIEYVQAGFLVVGVIAISSEYPGTIRTTLTTAPRRIHVYLAKGIALAAYSIPTAVAAVVTLYAVTRITLAQDAAAPDAGRLAAAAAYLVVASLIAFAIASGLRRTIPSVAVVLGYFFIVGPVLRAYTDFDWTPDTAGYAAWHASSAPPDLSASLGWAVLAAWSLGLLAIGAVAFRYRDA